MRRGRRRRTEDCCGMFAVLAKTRPSHLSGLDPQLWGQREHLRETDSAITHTYADTQTSKHTNMCESVSLFGLSFSVLTHNSSSCGGHLYISSLMSFLVLFVLSILSVMLTSSYEKISCHFPKKHTMVFFQNKSLRKNLRSRMLGFVSRVEKL